MKKLLLIFILLPCLAFPQHHRKVTQSTKAVNVTANYNEVITKQVKGQITSYITNDGTKFSVGDTIKIGVPFRNDVFTFLNQYAIIESYPLYSTAIGSLVKIKSLNAVTKKVQAITTPANGYVYQIFVMNFEEALKSGEISILGISSDEALQELKRCKDKLDLGLITQDEFDLKKAELSKFIK
jgi:hypothetical protein